MAEVPSHGAAFGTASTVPDYWKKWVWKSLYTTFLKHAIFRTPSVGGDALVCAWDPRPQFWAGEPNGS
jgi:hypothetical protein